MSLFEWEYWWSANAVPIVIPVGQTTEGDTAQPVTPLKKVQVGQTTEADTAQRALPDEPVRENQVVETDSAQQVGIAKTIPTTQVVETELAQSVSHVRVVALGQAFENEEVFPVTVIGGAPPPPPPVETGAIGGTFGRRYPHPLERKARKATIVVPVGLCIETDEAFGCEPVIIQTRQADNETLTVADILAVPSVVDDTEDMSNIVELVMIGVL